MREKQKEKIDNIIRVIMYIIFLPIVILYAITKSITFLIDYFFENILNPLYNKICILVRKPIPNSTVHVIGKDDAYFKRVNDKLLTIKEAKALGKQYEDKGYKVKLYLSEF